MEGCEAYTCVIVESWLPHYAASDTALLTQEPQLCVGAENRAAPCCEKTVWLLFVA